MKNRVIAVVLLSVLATGIAASIVYGNNAYNVSIFNGEKSFSLSAAGTAYDRISQRTVDVTLLLTGRINGPAKDNINLRIESGSATIENQMTQQIITVSKGSGLVNLKKETVHLELTTTQSIYGGAPSPWKLDGTATSQSQTQITITLSGSLVKLPTTAFVDLTNLELEGTLTIL